MAATHHPRLAVTASLAAAALLAGCASTRLDAQWSDPQVAPGSLRGARVMVACEAYDQVIKRICQDQMAAAVSARGGTPVPAPDTTNEAPGRPLGVEQYLPAARKAGAKVVMTHYVTQSDVSVSGPSSVSFGIGGFGFGGGGGGVSTGVGIGLCRGEVIIGNVGSPHFMSYTIIGDTVNTAARLMASARANEVLLEATLYDAIHALLPPERVEARGEVALRGKAEAVRVYSVAL